MVSGENPGRSPASVRRSPDARLFKMKEARSSQAESSLYDGTDLRKSRATVEVAGTFQSWWAADPHFPFYCREPGHFA